MDKTVKDLKSLSESKGKKNFQGKLLFLAHLNLLTKGPKIAVLHLRMTLTRKTCIVINYMELPWFIQRSQSQSGTNGLACISLQE